MCLLIRFGGLTVVPSLLIEKVCGELWGTVHVPALRGYGSEGIKRTGVGRTMIPSTKRHRTQG